MGVIQSAINQALGTAGIAARLSPGLEKRTNIKLAKQEESKLRSQTKQLAEEVTDVGKRIEAESALGLPEKRIESAKKQLDLGMRTPSNVAKIIENEQKGMDIAKGLKDKKLMIKPYSAQDLLKERQAQEMKKVAEKQDAQLNQKEQSMENYIKNLKTSLGGKVKDLPENMQKQIIVQLEKKGEMNKDGK